jgi:hypothetical protein
MGMLTNKIRINAHVQNRITVSGRHANFYEKYASFVSNTLKKPLFQRFVHWILKRENIDKSLVQDIQIRVFPLHNKNGNSLAGRWRGDAGKIFIFPKSFEFCKELAGEHGSEITRSYVKSRALATLIHEILHAKYSSDEERVRKLTERYFSIYTSNPKTIDFESVVFEKLFRK